MRVDVLNLEWSSSGRDREMATLINFLLRKKGYFVREASIFNWRKELLACDPRLLFITNSIGAVINFEVVRFAAQHQIPVVTLVSEGNFKPELASKMLWGWNTDHILYENLTCQWSKRTRDLSLEVNPELKYKIKVVGGVGFDRYKIYKFLNRKELIQHFTKDYKKVIGIASWGFDLLQGVNATAYQTSYGAEQISRFVSDGQELNRIYFKLIHENSDILFLLKEHPGVVDHTLSEFAAIHDLKLLPNIIYIKNEFAIGDCISASDLWIAYESTTCLEAWLLDKITFLINPSGPDFIRENVHKGSPIFTSFEQAQHAIEEFYKKKVVPGFKERNRERNKIIQDTIQWADGKNHMRAVYYIEQVLEVTKNKEHKPITFREKLLAHYYNMLFTLAACPFIRKFPKIRTFVKGNRLFDIQELSKLENRYYPDWEKFYENNSFTEGDQQELRSINQFSSK
jgi:hypothetical protein